MRDLSRASGLNAPANLSTRIDSLRLILDPSAAPLFWSAERITSAGAWCPHIPFAHWLMVETAPGLFVELGTHTGVSYSAFCEAVVRAGLATCCYAVDTWQGDLQTGT